MPNWQSLFEFSRELYGLEGDLTEDEVKKITRAQAVAGQKIANQAAARDVGSDRAFSGWRRENRIALDTQIRPARDNATLLTPTRQSAGPWTVAQEGRNQGGTTGFLGPGVNRSTGLTARTKSGALRKVRARQARRWNGYTAGKNTASEAREEMERVSPRVASKAVLAVTRKRFTVT